jgi:hypothetical protein
MSSKLVATVNEVGACSIETSATIASQSIQVYPVDEV